MEQNTTPSYVMEKVRAGASKKAIIEQLTTVGWSADAAEGFYKAALIEAGVPLPEEAPQGLRTNKASTLEVALNFFSFILLGIIATALGMLYFEVIEKYFPDPLAAASSYYGLDASVRALHYAMAALIVGTPLYMLIVQFWFRRYEAAAEKTESGLTKWLTYIVLLIAAVTVVGDLITVLFTFLQGEISVRFVLKALTILVIAGGVFGFYALERRRVQYQYEVPQRYFRLCSYVLVVFVLIGIIFGFLVSGSPGTQRDRALDQERADDLRSIAGCVANYTEQFGRLPESLTSLNETTRLSYCSDLDDPDTGVPYQYRIVTSLATNTSAGTREGVFELCATFSQTTIDQPTDVGYAVRQLGKWGVHESGRACDTERVVIDVPMGSTNTTPTPIR